MSVALSPLGLRSGLEHLGGRSGRATPEQTREAARQFEALLIQHLLKTAREAALPEEEDPAGGAGADTYIEIAEQHLALALAGRSGGFGIAELILRDLQPQQSPVKNPALATDKSDAGPLRGKGL